MSKSLQNLLPHELEDWKNEILDAKQWLGELQKAVREPEFKKIHGNIDRIERINAKLDGILSWLNDFK